MTQGSDIPFDIIHMIVSRVTSPSVESPHSWRYCVSILAVCRLWRMAGVPLLYANAIVNHDMPNVELLHCTSNIRLIVKNGFERHVRAVVVHLSPNIGGIRARAGYFMQLTVNLALLADWAPSMRNFWDMAARPWLSASGAVIEPLLMIMPNLRYMFVESRHFNEPWSKFKSTFIKYSIATRFDTQAGTRWLSLLDFVAGYSANIVDGLQSKVIMTREEEDEPTDDRVQGSSADDCEPGPPFDNCIRFCAEYIRRLHILDLPRSALGPSSSIGDLLDSTPCDIEENYLRYPWFGIRYRSMFHIPNIWYGLTRGGITRYEMFAFNRDTDSGALTAVNINGRGKKPFAPTAGE